MHTMRSFTLLALLCALGFGLCAFQPGKEPPALPAAYQALAKNDKARLTRFWGTPEQHVYVMTRVAYAQGGQTALVASNDPSEQDGDDVITVYGLDKRSKRRTLTIKKAVASALAITPDGKHACAATFAGTPDKTIVTLLHWDLSTGQVVQELKGPEEAISNLALSTDAALALTSTARGPAQVWDLKAGKLLHTLAGNAGPIFGMAISADGSQALISGTGPIKLWDLKTGKVVKDLPTPQTAGSVGLAFLPDGKRVVAVDNGQEPILWDIKDNKEIRKFKKEPLGLGATTLAVSADGKRLVALRSPYNQGRNVVEQWITCWDVDTGKEQWSTPVDLAILTPLAFHQDGQTVLLGGGESCFIELDAQTGQVKKLWGGHRGAVTQIAFEPKSGRFWTAGQDKTIKCWAPDGRRELFTFKGHDDAVTGLAVVGDTLLTAGNDKTLKHWQLGSGKMIRQMTGHSGGITSLAVSRDGKVALTGSSDRSLKLWNLGTGKDVKTITGHADSVTAVALSPSGKWAASGSADNTVRVWYLPDDGKDVEPIVLEGHTREVTAIAFLSEGRILSASQDQTMRLWNVEDGKLSLTFKGHKNWITSLAVSSDGKQAITTSDDLTIKVWDMNNGKEFASLDLGVAGDVAKCVALTPDGRAFLAGTANWLVLRFDLK
jgi:WD40 repeat protein